MGKEKGKRFCLGSFNYLYIMKHFSLVGANQQLISRNRSLQFECRLDFVNKSTLFIVG